MIQFIDDHKDEFGVEPVCRHLPIAPQTYYASKTRAPSPRSITDEALTMRIHEIHASNYGVYGGLKQEQYLVYGTPQWREVYGLRNGVESVNRSYKRAQNEDLQNPDRRHVRGNTFTYIIASFAGICENLRKILGFLKQRLALRPVTPKISDVPTLFWEPESYADDVESPHRC